MTIAWMKYQFQIGCLNLILNISDRRHGTISMIEGMKGFVKSGTCTPPPYIMISQVCNPCERPSDPLNIYCEPICTPVSEDVIISDRSCFHLGDNWIKAVVDHDHGFLSRFESMRCCNLRWAAEKHATMRTDTTNKQMYLRDRDGQSPLISRERLIINACFTSWHPMYSL